MAVPRSNSNVAPAEVPALSHSLPPLTPRSARPAPPTVEADATREDAAMPHINLGAAPAPPPADADAGAEWIKWVLLVLIAVATAVIAFYFMPT